MPRFLFFIILLTFALVFQTAHFFTWNGIGPDLLLLAWLLILFGRFEKPVGFWEILFSAVVFSAICFFFFRFWLKPISVLALLTVLIAALRQFFTGNKLVDFLISNAVVVFVFYGLLALIKWSGFSIVSVGWEALYNLLLGVCLWFLADFLIIHYAQTRT